MAYTSNSSYEGGRGRSSSVLGWPPGKNVKPYLEKQLKQKNLGQDSTA
jgi:hypothetical protein